MSRDDVLSGLGKPSGKPQSITVLGSTGSIGKSTLSVLAEHPQRFTVFALTAYRQWELLLKQCIAFKPRYAVLVDEAAGAKLSAALKSSSIDTEVLIGAGELSVVAAAADVTMAAIVGAAGLLPTMAAVNAGKKILLANKESLVMAGGLFMSAVAKSGAQLLPVDSEHNAIFQCLPPGFSSLNEAGVRKILLTGSGGPFRETELAALESVTPAQACNHPNWSMGQKISVDSATMMNKGLEFIEACWLFAAKPDDIDVVVHPQSIVHSMVEYIDGSVLAQLGQPDMRTPIAHALSWPQRIQSGVERLNFLTLGNLSFKAPCFDRFPCLALGIDAAKLGGSAPASLNAANEIAVDAFLQKDIGFCDIARINQQVLEKSEWIEPSDLAEVINIDQRSRQLARELVEQISR